MRPIDFDDGAMLRALAARGEADTGLFKDARRRSFVALDLDGVALLLNRACAPGALERERDTHALALARLLRDPDAAIVGGELIKHDRTTTLAAVSLGGVELVIKRYNRKSRVHGFTRLWRPTRARRSFDAARWLLRRDILTPIPLAFIERRSFGVLNHGAYLISLRHPGENLLDSLNGGALDGDDFDALIEEFRVLLKCLLRARAAHGDMKISNFIFDGERLCVLALDATRPYRVLWRARRAFRRDLTRLLRNWEGTPYFAAVEALVREFD